MLFISLRDFRRAPHFPFLFFSLLFFGRTRGRARIRTRQKKKQKKNTHKRGQAGRPSAHRSLEGSRKSIRAPSPFTFISHLFLIPPPFWSFLFPLARAPSAVILPVLRACEVYSQSISRRWLPEFQRLHRPLSALTWLAQVGPESARACALTMSGSRVRLVFFPAFAPANTAG